jgi:hypothetical protein
VKAAVCHRFGSPEVLELQDIAQPALTDDGVLVGVRASLRSTRRRSTRRSGTGDGPAVHRTAGDGAASAQADGARGRLAGTVEARRAQLPRRSHALAKVVITVYGRNGPSGR